MVFTSTIFLFAFLPLAIGAFYVVPARWRAAPLLLMSGIVVDLVPHNQVSMIGNALFDSRSGST